jgi:DivIVA domain-containing protein
MPRTAEEIAKRRFAVGFRGYRRREVEQFLNEVAADYARAVQLAQWAMERSGRGPAFDSLSEQIAELTTEVRALSAKVAEAPVPHPVSVKTSDWWPTEASLARVTRRRVSVGQAS